MKTIHLSKRKFKELDLLELDKDTINTEGTIFELDYNNYSGLLKKLYCTEGYSFGNKLYTLEMLDFYRDILPNCFVIPDSLVSVAGEVVGFTFKKINGYNLQTVLNDKSIDYKDKLYYLKSIGDVLDKIASIRKNSELKDLFISDLQECNFMVNPLNRDLSVIDLDSCKIANNIASPARYLTPKSLLNNVKSKYKINDDPNISAHVIPDANSDLYCYCIVVLKYLYGDSVNNMSLEEFYNYLNYLDHIGINKELLDGFYYIVSIRNNINISTYIESLTSENIVRSKKNVYSKVMKR